MSKKTIGTDDQACAESEAQGAVERRTFLKFVGAFAMLGSASHQACSTSGPAAGVPDQNHLQDWVLPGGEANWRSPAYPVPLPGDGGPFAEDALRLADFQVRDDLVLPEGFRYHIIARWGDAFGAPGHQIRFGSDNDYTGLLPVKGKPGEFWLMVNHEEVPARAWRLGFAAVFGKELPHIDLRRDEQNREFLAIGDQTLSDRVIRWSGSGQEVSEKLDAVSRQALDELCRAGCEEMGISILHVRRLADGRFEVIADAVDHRRITTISRYNITAPIGFSGPAAALLPAAPPGTFSNCSGGTTPWGTFLTCEENIQNHVPEAVDSLGQPLESEGFQFYADGTPFQSDEKEQIPTHYYGFGMGLEEKLDGRQYGWVCEVEPETGKLTKHTALGRFRHENVAIRATAGRRLACYMGDDRRGGHVWKYVSEGIVTRPDDPANAQLMVSGTLYAAVFDSDYRGRWIPIDSATPLQRPRPGRTAAGHMDVPDRPAGGRISITEAEVDAWVERVAEFCKKPFDQCTLGDLVKTDTPALKQGIILMDAFAMANAAGATPVARPEDLELHPQDGSIFIAFTDTTSGSDGSPDAGTFPESKQRSSCRYGSIYRLFEDEPEGAQEPTGFTWGRFVSSGEVVEGGGGFACCDNMVFDHQGNLWMTTDISTSAHNYPVTREPGRTEPGEKYFPGIFGNNAFFMVPTAGDQMQVPRLFAIGPSECELTGPTFAPDGRTLIISVQHPGGRNGPRTASRPDRKLNFRIADRDGQVFTQARSVPVGSNWPAPGKDGAVPASCVVCITRQPA